MSTTPVKSNRKPRTSSRKNIREAYINYVKQNNGLTGLKKSRSISNLDNYDPKITSSSNYLENQYSLVKSILTAQSALEKLHKKTTKDGKNNSNGNNNTSGLKSSRSTTSGTPLYKTQEEYYEEVMDLKKKVKLLEKNETLMKAKIEYYESELNKKNNEIEELLEPKQGDSRNANLKVDYRQVLNLKKKVHKLELQLKEKENKVQNLESDLKTTSLREMRIANDIMRQEIQRLNDFLSKTHLLALTDRDTNRSLISLNKENLNGKDNHNNALEIELNELKNENLSLNERIQKILLKQNNGNENHQVKKLNDDTEYYKQLCQTKENEILRLKKELDKSNMKDFSDDSSHSKSFSNSEIDSRSPSPKHKKKPSIKDTLPEIIKRKPSPALSKHSDENLNKNNNDMNYEIANAIDTLQSVFRGHAERTKFNEMEKKEINNENNNNNNKKKLSLDNVSVIEHKKRSPSPSRNKLHSRSPTLSRHNSNETLRSREPTPTKLKQTSKSNTKSKISNYIDDDDDVMMD